MVKANEVPTTNITPELIKNVPTKIQSGRVASKLSFADDDTADGVYTVEEIRLGTKGITLVTGVKIKEGKLAFFEKYDSPLGEFITDTRNVVPVLEVEVTNGDVVYGFDGTGYYRIDSKSWKLAR